MTAARFACLGDAPFGYVNVFHSHVNVGFFHGAATGGPGSLVCKATGKFHAPCEAEIGKWSQNGRGAK